MNPESPQKSNRALGLLGLLAAVIVIAAFTAYVVSRRGNTNSNHKVDQTASQPTSTSDVNKLISYSLPESWTEKMCDSTGSYIFVTPQGLEAPDCANSPSSPINIAVKDQITDCGQLQTGTNVKKHTCSSLFIDGHKTIKSLTEYPASGTQPSRTIEDYYLNTGNGVVKFEYLYTGDAQYQLGFDQLAQSAKVK